MGTAEAVRWLVALALLLSVAPAASRANTTRTPGPSEERPSTVVVEVSDDGFHWVDAGVGAAAAFATTLLAFGLVLALRPDRGGNDPRGKESR